MGIIIKSKNLEMEMEVGYGGFYCLKMKIAESISLEYFKLYKDIFDNLWDRDHKSVRKKHTDKFDKIVKLTNLIDNDPNYGKYKKVDAFLFMSDYDGKLPYVAAKQILAVIENDNIGRAENQNVNTFEKFFEKFKDLLRDCVENRHKLRWYYSKNADREERTGEERTGEDRIGNDRSEKYIAK
jgi:hypothetical protein